MQNYIAFGTVINLTGIHLVYRSLALSLITPAPSHCILNHLILHNTRNFYHPISCHPPTFYRLIYTTTRLTHNTTNYGAACALICPLDIASLYICSPPRRSAEAK